MSFPRPRFDPALRVTTGLRLRYTLTQATARITRLAWSPDGRSLAVPTRDGRIFLHDAATGVPRLELPRERDAVMGVAWSPDGRRLATISNARGTTIRDAESARILGRSRQSADTLTGVAWSPCGTRLAVSAERSDGAVVLFDATGSTMRVAGELAIPGALHVAWHPAGGLLAVGTRDGGVHWLDTRSRAPAAREHGHRDAVVHVAWAASASGDVLASASKDGTVGIRDPRPNGGRRVLTAHEDQVIAVAFDPTATLCASKSRDGTVRLWRVGLWHVVAAIAEPTADVGWSVGLAFHPGGRLLATLGDHDTIVRVWDLDRAALPAVPLEARVLGELVARPVAAAAAMRRRVRLR